MQLDRNVIQLLSDPGYVPMRQEEIEKALGLNKSQSRSLKRIIHRLLDDGVIARVKKDRFVLPRDADLVPGTIKFRAGGGGLLWPDGRPGEPSPEPLQIRAEDTHTALHGDKVLARLTEDDDHFRRRKDRRSERDAGKQHRRARVIRVLQRGQETITGTLQKSRMFFYVLPDDPRFSQDVLVPPPEQSAFVPRPKEGDKVVVRLHEWKQRHLNPEGEIIQVLGQTHEPMAEFKALLHNYQLSPEFPKDVSEQVLELPSKVTAKAIKGRVDCRELLTFTIDPTDAKDFDDALSIEKSADGWRVGVHIADVASYVRAGSPLDREARRRGNSTYLVGTVIPMLPHALSNGLCSLVEQEDRLTKSVFLTFGRGAKPLSVEFANTVIRSSKRLTYEQAHALMTQVDLDSIRSTPLPPAHQTGSTGRELKELSDRELKALQQAIKRLWRIASRMRKKRFKQGSLDLEMAETKIFVDKDGYADRIEVIEYDESHQLIEEFMLAANEAVARELTAIRLPFLSRVHDDPDPGKLLELRDEMILSGIKCGDLTNRREVNKLLAKIKEHPQAELLRIKFLRSLKQACYRAQPDGHFGLAKEFYAHFTSPIRRYADLTVHRQIDVLLNRRGHPSAPGKAARPYDRGDLDEIASHVSRTEQNSTEAERESRKIKLIEYFERELDRPRKSRFEALVTDVRNHGFFIELTLSGAYGMVHISTLRDDIYRLDPEKRALVGRKHQRRFAIGEKLEVEVERVDRFKRQIDFRVAPSVNERKRKR